KIIREILAQMGIGPQALVTAFRHEEDDEDYAVWKIEENDALYVLKKADEQELEIYQAFCPTLTGVHHGCTRVLNFRAMSIS
ncbi:MAG: hypothetical protein PUB59_07950, partial [Firmicutes bacterium]|nr:hypothetical protein [Bacillota bacterium]